MDGNPAPHPRSEPLAGWWCTNRYLRLRLPARLSEHVSRLCAATAQRVGLISCQRWICYAMHAEEYPYDLETLRALASESVEPLSEEGLAELMALAPTSNQLISGQRMWRHGLRLAYLARGRNGAPLAVVWVLRREDAARLRRLSEWGGMYPSIPAGWLQLENIYCFDPSLSRGRILVDLVHAAAAASPTPVLGILTHVHDGNRLARRWVEHFGCRAAGSLRRVVLNLPWLRNHPWYLHSPRPPDDIRPTPRPSVTRRHAPEPEPEADAPA